MPSGRQCSCGEGYASLHDNMCRFCRENKHASTCRERAKFGIKKGEGLTVEAWRKYHTDKHNKNLNRQKREALLSMGMNPDKFM